MNEGGVSGGDAWIIRLTGNGDIVWQETFGTENRDEAYAVDVTLDGGCIIAGETGLGSDTGGRAEFLVLKINGDGVPQWQKT